MRSKRFSFCGLGGNSRFQLVNLSFKIITNMISHRNFSVRVFITINLFIYLRNVARVVVKSVTVTEELGCGPVPFVDFCNREETTTRALVYQVKFHPHQQQESEGDGKYAGTL